MTSNRCTLLNVSVGFTDTMGSAYIYLHILFQAHIIRTSEAQRSKM